MSTLYEDIGGGQALRSMVGKFYAKVLDDPRLTGYFSGTDLTSLRRSQVAVFAAALGSEGVRPRRRANGDHAGRGIDHADFDLVICCLADALREVGVQDAVMTDVLLTIAPLARDIVPIAAQNRECRQRTSQLLGQRAHEQIGT